MRRTSFLVFAMGFVMVACSPESVDPSEEATPTVIEDTTTLTVGGTSSVTSTVDAPVTSGDESSGSTGTTTATIAPGFTTWNLGTGFGDSQSRRMSEAMEFVKPWYALVPSSPPPAYEGDAEQLRVRFLVTTDGTWDERRAGVRVETLGLVLLSYSATAESVCRDGESSSPVEVRGFEGCVENDGVSMTVWWLEDGRPFRLSVPAGEPGPWLAWLESWTEVAA